MTQREPKLLINQDSTKKLVSKTRRYRNSNFLNTTGKKKIGKVKRNKSARKRLLTVNKLNDDKYKRKGTTNTNYKCGGLPSIKAPTPLFPPIAQSTKSRYDNNSKTSFNSNFANDIKKKVNKEFIFKHPQSTTKKNSKYRKLSDFITDTKHNTLSRATPRKFVNKNSSDPLGVIDKESLLKYVVGRRNLDQDILKQNKFYQNYER